MSNVRVLPPDIVSKIAAGEVVERPASVVKELLENSLDAGADAIEINVKKSGKTYICLKDNGSGIASDDISLICKRHATSKITTLDDLYAISSFGFRGEALYSIASVADFLIRTKHCMAHHGSEMHMRGGEELYQKPANIPQGTEIIIKELFYNTPARKKFMKSDATEFTQILNVVIPYALLYPHKRFTLRHNEKMVIDLPPHNNRIERIAQTLNLKAEYFLETTVCEVDGGGSVQCYLGDANIQRTSRNLQFVFINNRPVQSKSLSFHINQAYRVLLPEHVYSSFVIFLTLPPASVDVNIHPTKREVHIAYENSIFAQIRKWCEDTLRTNAQTKKMVCSPFTVMPSSVCEKEPMYHRKSSAICHEQRDLSLEPTAYMRTATENILKRPHTQEETLLTLRDMLQTSRYIGQWMRTYLLFESHHSLLIIDQHAAQERIAFEILCTHVRAHTLQIQRLLSPIVLTLSPDEMHCWEEYKDQATTLGFETTLFDRNSVALHAHPHLLKNPERALRNILMQHEQKNYDMESLARAACRGSVMAGDIMSDEEARILCERLIHTHNPSTCPHGRPTVIEIKEAFLNRQFLRT